MKSALLFCTCVVFTIAPAITSRAQPSTAYLGQEAPGIVPEVFAPGLISLADEHEFGSVFSADGNEFFYGVDVDGKPEIRYTRLGRDGVWEAPRRLPLMQDLYGFNDPFLSPDERRLYFISDRPLDGRGEPKDIDIWYVERKGEGWSEPVNVGSPVNTASNEYYISFTESGTMYFSSNRHAEKDRDFDFDVFAAKNVSDGYAQPVKLGEGVNTKDYEADVFVAYDESYLIFSAVRREGLGRGDLYVSFKEPDGSWSQARNLGEPINTAGHELCPFVTKDGKLFFYTSNQDIYWVSTAILKR